MMINEFVERTGFNPLMDEYAEIEKAYMDGDADKDKFCETWLSSGEKERYVKTRRAKIMDLSGELEHNNMVLKREIKRNNLLKAENQRLMERIESLLTDIDALEAHKVDSEKIMLDLNEAKRRAYEAERKLATLKAAFAILREEA